MNEKTSQKTGKKTSQGAGRKKPRRGASADAGVPPAAPAASHGDMTLASVRIESYSLELRDEDGFVGDQASQTAFRELLERWRRRKRKRNGKDPLGKAASADISKTELDVAMRGKTASEATDVVHGAIEEFAVELVHVIRRYLRQGSWRGVQRIVIGGGFPGSGVGERAVLQAGAMLHNEGSTVELARLCHEVDDGGLIGWVHLVPPEVLAAHDAVLAVDIGGTNVRCGIVKPRIGKAADLSHAKVVKRVKWRHADDKPSRKALVRGIVGHLHDLMRHARRKGIGLAPFVGIACPGLIREDGSIARGAQNLPGDWNSSKFHLPTEIAKALGPIGKQLPEVRLHNDAVVQGLSELPFMQDVKHWGVLTIGTGLGNVSFTNRHRRR